MPKGYSKHNQGGWKHSKKSINLMKKNRVSVSNELNPRWKGDNVSYQALHNWIRKHFKKPNYCEFCKENPGINKRGYTKLQWANKTKKYLRNREDWICLCVKCHKKNDLKNKVKHRYESR